jgi:hypothetical protein
MKFHDYIILGKTSVSKREDRDRLLAALYGAIGNGEMEACYNPRHAIHAELGGKSVDLVICFECLQIEVHDSLGDHYTTISDAPRDLFNAALRSGGVDPAPN